MAGMETGRMGWEPSELWIQPSWTQGVSQGAVAPGPHGTGAAPLYQCARALPTTGLRASAQREKGWAGRSVQLEGRERRPNHEHQVTGDLTLDPLG